MKPGDLEYQALVQKIMDENRAASFSQARRMVAQSSEPKGNVVSAKLSPEETAAEIAQITDGAKSSFADEELITLEKSVGIGIDMQPKKRRGRPPGSKNRPKGS